MYERKNVGKWGEDIACKYLEKTNYNVIERNFKCNQGEIDIIAYDTEAKELVFVEVKTRTNFNYGYPADAVTKLKKIHIRRSMEYYLFLKNCEDYYIRVDVIEIVTHNGKYKLNHLKNVL